MNRIYLILFIIFLFQFAPLGQIVPVFEDNFDTYIVGQPLACQNPVDWSTWNNLPCSSEDPYISNNFAYNGTKSCVIGQNNDLVKQYENLTFGTWYIDFRVYIPTGKAGYFNNLSDFTFGTGGYWAMEVYFDAGGSGRLITGSTTNFTWTQNTWQHIRIKVDLNNDDAEFWLDETLIENWQWTQGASGGIGPLTLEATDFFGATAIDEMYIDNFQLGDICLSCYPPSSPSNLSTQVIYNPNPQVQLNWQDNSWNENIFYVLRKNGLPIDPNVYHVIGSVNVNITQFVDSNVFTDSTYTYGIRAYNQFGYSDTSNFATITVLPVPVELTSFTGIANNGTVELNWTTASETNNQMFEIQRQSSGSEFTTIGFVSGHGTTTETQQYNYVDRTVSTGIYSYRLKQIDFDGTYEYSDAVEVDVQAPLEFALDQNYPNPFNPITNIRFQIAKQGLVSIKVYDLLGKEVAILVNEEKEAGNYEVEFEASFLSSGMYIYKLTTNDFSSSRKMLLMK